MIYVVQNFSEWKPESQTVVHTAGSREMSVMNERFFDAQREHAWVRGGIYDVCILSKYTSTSK